MSFLSPPSICAVFDVSGLHNSSPLLFLVAEDVSLTISLADLLSGIELMISSSATFSIINGGDSDKSFHKDPNLSSLIYTHRYSVHSHKWKFPGSEGAVSHTSKETSYLGKLPGVKIYTPLGIDPNSQPSYSLSRTLYPV